MLGRDLLMLQRTNLVDKSLAQLLLEFLIGLDNAAAELFGVLREGLAT